MNTKIIPIGYKEVSVFKGTERDLYRWVKRLVVFDKFYCFAIFASLIYSGYALIHWDIIKSIFWDRVFVFVLFIAFVLLICAAIKERTFAKIKRIKDFTFMIDNIEVVEDGGMFVDAYKAEDEDKMFKYRFYFDTTFEFSWDFFILHQVYLNGRKNFYYCRKSGK